MIIYCLIGLLIVVLLLDLIQTYIMRKEVREYLKGLTGKPISKAPKDNKTETSERSDKKEFLIQKAKEESKKLSQVEAEFNKKIKEITI